MGRSKAPDFEAFWRAYPVHKARRDAETAWKCLTASDRTAAVAGIAAYAEACREQGVALKYGQGYLNGRRWEDEPDGEGRPASGHQITAVFVGEAPCLPTNVFDDQELW